MCVLTLAQGWQCFRYPPSYLSGYTSPYRKRSTFVGKSRSSLLPYEDHALSPRTLISLFKCSWHYIQSLVAFFSPLLLKTQEIHTGLTGTKWQLWRQWLGITHMVEFTWCGANTMTSPSACSAWLFILPRTTCLGVALPIVGFDLAQQSLIKKIPPRLAPRPTEEGIFSMEVSHSRMTVSYDRLSKINHQSW